MSKFFKLAICALIIIFILGTAFSVRVMATEIGLLDDALTVKDTRDKLTYSDGTLTAKAESGKFSYQTNNITFTNNLDVKAKLTFTYSVTNHSAKSGLSADSGSYTADLEADASVTISITGNKKLFGSEAVLTMSDISLTAVSDSSNVTFTYDSTYGSITVGGTATADGDIVNIASSGAALVATPVSGATFLGWLDGSNQLMSTSASYTLTPVQDMTVQAVFIGANSAPWFGVGSGTEKTQSYGFLNMSKFSYHEVASYTHLFDNLNTAATTAASNGKYVVLLNSGTLPAGDYAIPSGVTLLIPFDSANTTYTTAAQFTDTYTKPVEYRTLTMAEGANLVINGSMSISAKQKYAAGGSTYGGMAVGNTGFVRMNSGSSITVNSGGALYSYGYIIGSGTVTAKSGATVYEGFQIMDFRGGSQSTGMKNGVFPLSQYYVQNIEVSLTLEAGAAEYAYTWMNMSSATFGSAVKFIGPTDAMFKISNGSITKYYDAGTDRLMIEVDGDLSISSVSLSFAATVGTKEISSEDFVLGLNGNISVTINGGTTTINQDIAMQPGAHLTIGEKASVVIGAGKRLYVYDSDQWGTYVHYKNTAVTYVRPLIYAPTRNPQTITEEEGRALTNADLTDASILVKGTLDASKGYIYTTASGAQITGSEGGRVITVPGADTITYQLKQQADPVTYDQIPITPAKLINSDATIVETGKGADDAATTYTYTNGSWRCVTHSYDDWGTIREATCVAAGAKQRTCSVCSFVENGTIDALGHDETGEWQSDGTNHYKTCQRTGCGEQILTDTHTEVIDTAVAPTCTETGLTAGKHCSVCNEVIVAQTTVPALGHTPGEAVYEKPNTDKSTCDSVVYCDCGAEISRETNVPMICLDAINASADAEIILMLYFTDPHSQLDSATPTVTMITNGNVLPSDDFKFEQAGERYLVSQPVASGEMTSPVTVTFTDNQGNVIPVYDYVNDECGTSVTRTVKDYAERVMEIGTEEQKAIINALVTYGGYSQLNFGTNTSNLAYGTAAPELGTVTISQTVETSGDSIDLTQEGQQAFLDSAIKLRVYFVLSSGSIKDYTFTLKRPNGSTATLTAEYDNTRGKYYVDIENIPAAYLDNDYTLTVTRGNETYTVATSVFAYLKDLLANSTDENQINAAKAMYLYGTAASTFFDR